MKKLLILITLLCVFFSSMAQVQIGKDIVGDALRARSGWSVALSSDSLVMAIGAPFSGESSGLISVFQYVSGSWVQMGKDIAGEKDNDLSGYSVSLSSNGRVVAIGSPYNIDSLRESGQVRVYRYQAGSWAKMGEFIFGEMAYDRSGYSVSLSSDGNRIAIGAHNNDGNGRNSGHVRVYQFHSGSWNQLGNDMDGEMGNDESGASVSLSQDGSTVAIGATFNAGNGAYSGHTRIYRYNSGSWKQLGKDIDGENARDRSGCSVSLSSDGSIVAIGARLNSDSGTQSGHVRIFQYQAGTWIQIGKDIDGEAEQDQSGWSVSLSADGSIVAIGAIYNNDNGVKSGHTRIYQNNSGTWKQIGNDMDGEGAGDWSGYAVSLSSDGSVVGVGEPNNKGGGIVNGQARVYELCELKKITSQPKGVTMPVGRTIRLGLKGNYQSFQWQMDEGFGYQNLTNTNQFGGVNTDTLLIQNLTIANNQQKFRCMVSTSGCLDTSDVALLNVDGDVGIEELGNSFRMYPNPATELVSISVQQSVVGSSFKVLNLLGQEVQSGIIQMVEFDLYVSELPSGHYVFVIEGDKRSSHKFRVE